MRAQIQFVQATNSVCGGSSKEEENRKGGKEKRKRGKERRKERRKECCAVSRPGRQRTRNCAIRSRFPPTLVILSLGAV